MQDFTSGDVKKSKAMRLLDNSGAKTENVKS
jgi:hypothetical protein